jgi:hypothetical protein
MTISLATRLAGGGNACYGDLQPGDVFHFPKRSDVVFVKGRGGWYTREASAQKFRTGSGTAVIAVPRQEA